MLARTIFSLLVFLSFHSYAGIIVLKNGKIIPCDGPYEVKGSMLQYTANGSLFQLPLKIVDLEKSSKDAKAPEPEAKSNEEVLSQKQGRKKQDLSSFKVERKDDVVATPKNDTAITNDSIKMRYKTNNRHGIGKFESKAIEYYFWTACRLGDFNVAQYMLQQGTPFEGGGYHHLEQPIIVAVREGHKHIAALLIQAGADLEPYGNDGKTPLILALERKSANHRNILPMLLKAGANVNTPAKNLETPLELAIKNHKKEIVGALLKRGADPNHATKDKDYPIFKAIEFYDPTLVGMLIKAGADVNKVGKKGNPPLIAAVEIDSLPIAALLLEADANPQGTNKKEENALDIAITNNKVKMAAFLLEKSPDYKLKSTNQRLLSAVQAGADKMTGFLLEQGGDPNSQSEKGDPLLYLAAKKGNLNIVTLLLSKNADPYAKGADGVTAYVVASGPDKNTIRKLLRASYNKEKPL